jgi:hypothetical protein
MMAWWDDLLGPLNFISMGISTAGRSRPTQARRKAARRDSGAVIIRAPHPDARIRRQAADPARVPSIDDVEVHLRRNGIRTWQWTYNSQWIAISARASQRRAVLWLLGGSLDVTDRDQLRDWSRRWGR